MHVLIAVPVRVAQHTASVRGIDFHCIGLKRKIEGGAGQKVADNRLQVSIRQSAARGKGGQPFRRGWGAMHRIGGFSWWNRGMSAHDALLAMEWQIGCPIGTAIAALFL